MKRKFHVRFCTGGGAVARPTDRSAVDGAGCSDYYGRRLFVVLVHVRRFASDRAATELHAVGRRAR
jgi:hypothetical protein